MSGSVQLRPAAVQDADALVPLLAELGYPVAADLVRDNVRRLAHTEVDRVWVAERGGTVLGVVSVHLTPLFHAAGCLGRVTSLVVRADARGHGIGRMLMRQAEAFCWAAGCERVELTSGDHRAEAHRFYEALGYRVRSRRFVKDRSTRDHVG